MIFSHFLHKIRNKLCNEKKFEQKYREKLELPDQFLRACTLREGAWVIILFLNVRAMHLLLEESL